ncbi:hypothetical protein ACFYWO_39095 [Streptomyces sp. NPDC002932]
MTGDRCGAPADVSGFGSFVSLLVSSSVSSSFGSSVDSSVS